MNPEKWDRVYEHVKAQQFELKALTPDSWQIVSLTLKRAADRLYDHYHDATLRSIQRSIQRKSEERRKLEGDEVDDYLDGQLISVYFLLVGYAFENLLKALLMNDHPEYFKPNAKMKDIKSHDLVDLCKRCKISLQSQETSLLGKLTAYIEWRGKYPIPLETKRMLPIKQSDGTWQTQGEAFRGRQTQQEIDNLYIKIWGELERRHKSETDPGASD